MAPVEQLSFGEDSGAGGNASAGEGTGDEPVESSPNYVAYPALAEGEYSHSKLSTFDQCPKSYELRYVQGVPGIPGGAAAAGSSIHAGIAEAEKPENLWWQDYANAKPGGALLEWVKADFTARLQDQGGPDVHDWSGKKYVNPLWKQGDPIEDRKMSENHIWWWRHGFQKMLIPYCRVRQADQVAGYKLYDDPRIGHGVEMMLRTTLELPGLYCTECGFRDPEAKRPCPQHGKDTMEPRSVSIRGILDQFVLITPDGIAVVRDWKSGTYVDPHPLQLATYAWLVLQALGIPCTLGEIIWLRGVKPETLLKQFELEEWVKIVPQILVSRINGIEAGVYEPRPNMLCASCWVRMHCPVGVLVEANEQKKAAKV